MKKLMKAFKSLPREVRTMLAMAGLASPIGAIYFLKRFFPGVSMFVLIICVAGAIAVLALLGYVICKIFKRGGKKRSQRMATELASDSTGGPAGMDVSAAIKANNEKFFTAVREMRKDVGISVYDLPWYIVMGDSGCGKTYLVNNGGLTFSRGKPEGYQLGTLNYNWWFTEDAVFIDMAGRLCNPQDDSDRREWEAFLGTVGRGRKGFPINGAIVCVSAEHLLQDSPEKHESDANIALERLRDLQTKLGVTFATYLIVTKCDKIPGFMQFFDRADRDITVKNQVFGWSKPGEFNDLYDPEKFKGDFDSVYARLNELRLRRLNDDADDIELGLAYSFPEEFRELSAPLETYVRTLFPMIRNPRAVKNLLFRGVYFTSATQEGELILKHLKSRLGEDVAGQFAPLEALYPTKRPHFIKDVLFKKVFPEHGLVFRNEQQVLRNRRLSKVLKVSTVALGIVFTAAFLWSFFRFEDLIIEPRQHAQVVAEEPAARSADQVLRHATTIAEDISYLEANHMVARVLSIGIGHDEPVNHLRTMRVRLIEAGIERVLAEVDEVLRSGGNFDWRRPGKAEAFANALEQYIRWYGCRGQAGLPAGLDVEGFEAISALAPSGSIAGQAGFMDQAGWYFETLREGDGVEQVNPARLLKLVADDPRDTILKAIESVYRFHLTRYATFNEEHPNVVIREWMRLRRQCMEVQQSYEQMLGAADRAGEIETVEELRELQGQFVDQFGILDEALAGLQWRAEQSGSFLQDILPLKRGILQQRDVWLDYEKRLREAATHCVAVDPKISESIDSISAGNRTLQRGGLDETLWRNLVELGIAQVPYRVGVYDQEDLGQLIREVYEFFAEIVELVKGDSEFNPDELKLTTDAEAVRDHLRTISENLAGANFEVSADLRGETMEGWIDTAYDHLEKLDKEQDSADVAGLSQFWQPEALEFLYQEHRTLILLGEGTRLLNTIIDRLSGLGPWGIAELVPYDEYAAEMQSPYSIRTPMRGSEVRESGDTSTARKPKTTKRTGRRRRRGGDSFGEDVRGAERHTVAPHEERRSGGGNGRIPACVSHDFLNERAEEVVSLLMVLGDMRGAFLGETRGNTSLDQRCISKLEQATQVYMEAYVKAWSDAYAEKELTSLQRLTERVSDWGQLAERFEGRKETRGVNRYEIAEEFANALSCILRAVPWATYRSDGYSWDSASDPEWQRVSFLMEDAIRQSWDQDRLGRFVFDRKATGSIGKTGEQPWDVVAGLFRDKWLTLSEEIGRNVALPERFDLPDSKGGVAVSWGGLQDLREAYRIDDEDRLTGALVRFEERAQSLLSVELSRILYDIQERSFRGDQPLDGWPYLEGEAYGPNALDTVGFREFVEFLVKIHRAKEAFREVESSLTDRAPGRRERKELYRVCEEWFKFLELEDNLRVQPSPLEVTVQGDTDATAAPFGRERVDETAQFVARYIVMNLGLTLGKDERAGEGTDLRIHTETDEKVKTRHATWDWPTGGGELSVKLEDMLPGVKVVQPSKMLGRSSPLALCAYLHRYGKSYSGDATRWFVVHAFERDLAASEAESSRMKKSRVGEKIVFKLERGLPEPIAKLNRVKASASD